METVLGGFLLLLIAMKREAYAFVMACVSCMHGCLSLCGCVHIFVSLSLLTKDFKGAESPRIVILGLWIPQ